VFFVCFNPPLGGTEPPPKDAALRLRKMISNSRAPIERELVNYRASPCNVLKKFLIAKD
jgi:hypothetical protein